MSELTGCAMRCWVGAGGTHARGGAPQPQTLPTIIYHAIDHLFYVSICCWPPHTLMVMVSVKSSPPPYLPFSFFLPFIVFILLLPVPPYPDLARHHTNPSGVKYNHIYIICVFSIYYSFNKTRATTWVLSCGLSLVICKFNKDSPPYNKQT